MKNLLLVIALMLTIASCAGSYDVTSTILDIINPVDDYYR